MEFINRYIRLFKKLKQKILNWIELLSISKPNKNNKNRNISTQMLQRKKTKG